MTRTQANLLGCGQYLLLVTRTYTFLLPWSFYFVGDDYYQGKVRYVNISLDDKPLASAAVTSSSSDKSGPTTATPAAVAETTSAAVFPSNIKNYMFDNESLSMKPTSTADEKGHDDIDEEVSFKSEDISASDEVRLMAQVICDLNSDPVVVLGNDKLSEEVIQKYVKRRKWNLAELRSKKGTPHLAQVKTCFLFHIKGLCTMT